jgi:inorganic pyrophosphatase
LKAEYGIIAFRDVLRNSLKWLLDYGFIPQTLADDGDPLDILAINKAGLFGLLD